MMTIFRLFSTFFRIGLFTFGGGYAMIPMMQSEIVDRHKWLSGEEMADVIAVAQTTPGVFAINMSTYVGYKMAGLCGALVASLAAALPSLVIILLVAIFFRHFQDNPVVAAVFAGIRPAVVALIAVPTFNMARTVGIGWKNCWIPILSALAIWALGISPILIILIAGVAGYVYGRMKKTKRQDAVEDEK